MTFEEMLDHALAMLQRRGRLTYHSLQRQFHLDDDAFNLLGQLPRSLLRLLQWCYGRWHERLSA